MRSEGFLLYTDIGQAFLEVAQTADIQPVQAVSDIVNEYYYEEYASSTALYMVANNIRGAVIKTTTENDGYLKLMAPDDAEAVRDITFSNGLADLDFTWHFSAGVANAATWKMLDEGVINQTEYDELTLNDWAKMIESEWFSKLIHSMAFTDNSLWQNFGKAPYSFTDTAFEDFLRQTYGQRVPALEVYKLEDTSSETGLHTFGAKVNYVLKNLLRESLRAQMGNSVGCPVARLALRMEQETIDSNVHAQRLIESERIEIDQTTDGRVALRQKQTIISDALQIFAGQLRAYEEKYGTPYFVRSGADWEVNHRQRI